MIQSGNPIVVKENKKLVAVLAENLGQNKVPAQSVLEFYSEFSNPSSTVYSWNRGLLNSKDYFTK